MKLRDIDRRFFHVVGEFMFKGIILDMDGTITKPVIDFQQLREELGICKSGDVLEIIKDLPTEHVDHINITIEKYEQYAIDNMSLQDGFIDFYNYCNKQSIKMGLLTRNRIRNVEALCSKYNLTFDHIVTRDFEFVKPSPEPALHILSKWECSPSECIFVGDYIHDINCGKSAGMKTCFMCNHGHKDFSDSADYSVENFFHLLEIIRI